MRFNARSTLRVALCVALAASGGQPLWAAAGKQAQSRAPSLAPIPALSASIPLQPIDALMPGLSAPVDAISAEAPRATAVLTAVGRDVAAAERSPAGARDTLEKAYEGSRGVAGPAIAVAAPPASGRASQVLTKVKGIVRKSAPLIVAAPLVAMAAGVDSPSGMLPWLALPILGMISNKEKWEKIKAMLDDEGFDPSVKQAIQERERALALLKSSKSRQDLSGSSIEMLLANLTTAKAAAAVGEEAQGLIDQAKSQAYWWDEWLEIAQTEQALGIDYRASLEATRQRAWSMSINNSDFGHEVVLIDYALAAHQMGQDVREDLARARMQITEYFIEIPPLFIEEVVQYFERLIRTEIETKVDPKESIEAMRAAIGRQEETHASPSEQAMFLTSLAELEIEAGLDPGATLRAAEAAIQQEVHQAEVQGVIARLEAKAALALLKKSAGAIWRAFRIGSGSDDDSTLRSLLFPILIAAGLLAFLAPASALAATVTASAGSWLPSILAALGIGAFGGVLSLEKWKEIDALTKDENTDASLKRAIEEHAEARRLLEEVKTKGRRDAASLATLAVIELEAGIDPTPTLNAAEQTLAGAAWELSIVAAAKGLAGKDPSVLLSRAKEAILTVAGGRRHPNLWIRLAEAEAFLGRDYRESLDYALRALEGTRPPSMDFPNYARDIAFLVAQPAARADIDPGPALRAAREVNDRQKHWKARFADAEILISATERGELGYSDPFAGVEFQIEHAAMLWKARELFKKSRPHLWPLHRVGPAPL